MTPIERVTAKSNAYATLGLTAACSKSELRSAYRKLAFEMHPDHGKGTADDFREIAEAYKFLNDIMAGAEPIMPRPAANSVSRPTLKPTEIEFDEAALRRCRDCLVEDSGEAAEKHIPASVIRNGRALTYIVHSRPARGRNRVALPVAGLTESQAATVVLTVAGYQVMGGDFVVSDHLCKGLFPGARSVTIRFAG